MIPIDAAPEQLREALEIAMRTLDGIAEGRSFPFLMAGEALDEITGVLDRPACKRQPIIPGSWLEKRRAELAQSTFPLEVYV